MRIKTIFFISPSYYKRAGMRNKRFVIQSKHAMLFNKFKHSLQTETCCYSGKKVLDGFMGSPTAASLHEYCEKCARYAKLGRINEIINAAESLLPRVRRVWGHLVFIRRLDRHKFSTIGLAIFPPFETFISAERAREAQRDPGIFNASRTRSRGSFRENIVRSGNIGKDISSGMGFQSFIGLNTCAHVRINHTLYLKRNELTRARTPLMPYKANF